MSAYDVLVLNTDESKIQVAQVGDTYSCPRSVNFADGWSIASTAVTVSASQINEGIAIATASTVSTLSTVKIYKGLLTHTGTDDPEMTVLENSLGGTVVWTRTDVGRYRGTLAGIFPISKTLCIYPKYFRDDNFSAINMSISGAVDYLNVTCDDDAGPDPIEAELTLLPIMVFVYP